MNNVLIIFSDQFYNVENIIKPRGSFKRLKFYNEENRKEMGRYVTTLNTMHFLVK